MSKTIKILILISLMIIFAIGIFLLLYAPNLGVNAVSVVKETENISAVIPKHDTETGILITISYLMVGAILALLSGNGLLILGCLQVQKIILLDSKTISETLSTEKLMSQWIFKTSSEHTK